jgi:hypothetical protein
MLGGYRHAAGRAISACADHCRRRSTPAVRARSALARVRFSRWFQACLDPARPIVGGMLMGLDRPAAAEFSFFLAMPTMMAAFAHSLLKVRHHLGSERAVEIVVGFVMAFIASVLVVRPFLGVVRRTGFAPFAWYRIVLGLALFGANCGSLVVAPPMQWLRRSFITGFFVTWRSSSASRPSVWIFRPDRWVCRTFL